MSPFRAKRSEGLITLNKVRAMNADNDDWLFEAEDLEEQENEDYEGDIKPHLEWTK